MSRDSYSVLTGGDGRKAIIAFGVDVIGGVLTDVERQLFLPTVFDSQANSLIETSHPS